MSKTCQDTKLAILYYYKGWGGWEKKKVQNWPDRRAQTNFVSPTTYFLLDLLAGCWEGGGRRVGNGA